MAIPNAESIIPAARITMLELSGYPCTDRATAQVLWISAAKCYEQLASVFREMGHDEDARAVLIAKERLQRLARRRRARSRVWRLILAAKDGLLGATVAYGRQPLLAFVWLIFFWLLGVPVFWNAEREGAFKPSSPVILRSPGSDARAASAVPSSASSPRPSRRSHGRAEKNETQLDLLPEPVGGGELSRSSMPLDLFPRHSPARARHATRRPTGFPIRTKEAASALGYFLLPVDGRLGAEPSGASPVSRLVKSP